jgi:phosphomannomutase/phosphoglucomutase
MTKASSSATNGLRGRIIGSRLLRFLLPGWHIKRWLVALFLGILLLSLGFAYVLVHLYRTAPFPSWVYYLTLQFIPHVERGILLGVIGVSLVAVSFFRLSHTLVAPFAAKKASNESLVDVVYDYYHGPSEKPKVVVFAGTDGLSTLLRIAKEVPWQITGVVPPLGSGAAFSKLRRGLGTSGEEVLFSTTDKVQIVAELEDGRTLAGESQILRGRNGSPVKKVWLESMADESPGVPVTASPEVIEALDVADAVVIGPGSLFTNIIPTMLVPEINEILKRSTARKIFVCNIMTQPNVTEGYSVADHVRAIQNSCGFRLDYVLVSRTEEIADSVLARYRSVSAEPVGSVPVVKDDTQIILFEDTPEELVLVEGALLIERDLVQQVAEKGANGVQKIVLRHDPLKLSAAVSGILRDYAFQAKLSASRAVFREYDIRGVADADLTAGAIETIGKAFGTYIQRTTGRNKVVVGRDVRLSSERFFGAVTEGLLSTGCHVVDTGVVPTPALTYAIDHVLADGAVMVTASHNPAEFNGLKLQVGPYPLAGEALQHVERLIAKNQYEVGKGSMDQVDVLPRYLDCIRERVRPERRLKVVVDGGNGTAGLLGSQLIEDLGCEVVPLYCEPDGRFPNHEPDPLVEENIREMQAAVVRESAHVGIGFDGDGDRLGVVDEQGNMVLPDKYVALLAREFLVSGPGKVVLDVRCSQSLIDDVTDHGGIPLVTRCGNAYILQKMRQENAVLGVELSGHVFFNDPPLNSDDALLAAGKLIEYLSKTEHSLSELVQGLPQYYSSPEMRIPCPETEKFSIVEAIKESFIETHEVLDIDGARIRFDGGWALVRASNTQPVLSVRMEGRTEEDLLRIQETVTGRIARFVPLTGTVGA